MMNESLTKKRLSKTCFIGRILAHLPYVRCVILNGSLASGGHKKSSDIDILIIAKTGRIFSARFFVNLFAILLGVKRPKDQSRSHAGKFCFNYFLTEDHLKINYPKEREKYCAENYSKSKFIAGDYSLFEKFMKENQKLFKKYGLKETRYKKQDTNKSQISNEIKNFKFKTFFFFRHPELVSGSKRLNSLKRFRNKFGMTPIGDWFENVVQKYQIKKIISDPRTVKYPKQIVFNDKELRFHPPK